MSREEPVYQLTVQYLSFIYFVIYVIPQAVTRADAELQNHVLIYLEVTCP